MTKKRYVKLFMSKGVSRNRAVEMANTIRPPLEYRTCYEIYEVIAQTVLKERDAND